MVYKWCVASQCTNTSINRPHKLFLSVPRNKKIRKMWFQLARRDPKSISSQSHVFMCEDHFNMDKDTINYMQYKMGFSQKIFLAVGAMPSKFLCHDDRKKRVSDAGSSEEVLTKRRKNYFGTECLLSQSATECHAGSIKKEDVMMQDLEPEVASCMDDGKIKTKLDDWSRTMGEMGDADIKLEHDELNVDIKEEIEDERVSECEIKTDPSFLRIQNPDFKIKSEETEALTIKEENAILHNDFEVEEFKVFTEEEEEKFKATADPNMPSSLLAETIDSDCNEELYTNDYELSDDCLKPFKCKECGKHYARKMYLAIHILTSHSGKTPFACDQCDKSFPFKSKLKRHLRVHSFDKPFQCDQCDKVFPISRELKRHVRVHSDVHPYQCDECGRRFKCKGHFSRHVKVHSVIQQFKCDHCGKCFNSVGKLKKHLRIHSGIKPYNCEQCDKCFAILSELKAHFRVHSGVKQFKCDQCEKCFKWEKNLKSHLKMHSKIKQSICEHCGKVFGVTSELKRHLHVHSGFKQFDCDKCDKRFKWERGLKAHAKVHGLDE